MYGHYAEFRVVASSNLPLNPDLPDHRHARPFPPGGGRNTDDVSMRKCYLLRGLSLSASFITILYMYISNGGVTTLITFLGVRRSNNSSSSLIRAFFSYRKNTNFVS